MKEAKDNLVRYRITKARETIEDARILANANRWNPCVNRLYYACFYAVSALLPGIQEFAASLISILLKLKRSLRSLRRYTMIFLSAVRKVTTWILFALKKNRLAPGLTMLSNLWSTLQLLSKGSQVDFIF